MLRLSIAGHTQITVAATAVRELGSSWPLVARRAASEVMQFADFALKGEITKSGAVNTGALRNSTATLISLEGSGAAASVRGSVTLEEPYAKVMNDGRRIGARMPPAAPIELWLRRRVGLTADEAQRISYVIRRSISRKGIRGRKFQQAAARRVRAMAGRTFARHIRQARLAARRSPPPGKAR
jgi:hypothetical protein